MPLSRTGRPDPRLSPTTCAPGRSGPEHNDDTLDQLKQRAASTAPDTICRPAAPEIDLQEEDPARRRARPPDVQEERGLPEEGEAVEPKRLVFVDESGVTTAMTRPTAGPRAASGRRLGPRLVESLTVIAALVWTGYVPRWCSRVDRHRGVRVVCRAGAGAGAARRRRGRMDNLSPHQAHAAAAAVSGGARLLPLPPYSPTTRRSRDSGRRSSVPPPVAAQNKDAVYDALGESSKVTTQTSSAGSSSRSCARHIKPL